MPELVLALAFIVCGALARRVAGGLIPTGSTLLGRALGAAFLLVPALVLAYVRGYPTWWGLAVPPLYWVGLCLAAFPQKPGGGSIMIPVTLKDVLGISVLNGLPTIVALMATLDLLYYFGPSFAWPGAWLIVTGFLFGPAYYLGKLWAPPIRWLGVLDNKNVIQVTAMGELYTGALVGLAIYLTVGARP